MNNTDLLEYMKERFDLMALDVEKMENRLISIEKDMKPLTEHKAATNASIATMKFLIVFGIGIVPILITILMTFLK